MLGIDFLRHAKLVLNIANDTLPILQSTEANAAILRAKLDADDTSGLLVVAAAIIIHKFDDPRSH